MDIVARAAFMFVFLYVLLRIMGKRELGAADPVRTGGDDRSG